MQSRIVKKARCIFLGEVGCRSASTGGKNCCAGFGVRGRNDHSLESLETPDKGPGGVDPYVGKGGGYPLADFPLSKSPSLKPFSDHPIGEFEKNFEFIPSLTQKKKLIFYIMM